MSLAVGVAFSAFGLIIGSFLNVLVLRRSVRSAAKGRSACLSCDKKLRWYELVPVASWIAQNGRCRTCGGRISIQYPLVEIVTAIVFGILAGAISDPLALFIALLAASLMILIATYDILHTIIPNEWVYTFAAAALSLSLYNGGDFLTLVIAGPIAAAPLFGLWLVSRGTWMGFGDVKLTLGQGWLLGIFSGIYALFLAFVVGAVVGVCILIPQRHYNMKSEVPFGPFLVFATFVVWIMHLYNIPLPFTAL